jgi:hypothetical protein
MGTTILTEKQEAQFTKWWNEDHVAKLWRERYVRTFGQEPEGGPNDLSDNHNREQWLRGQRPCPKDFPMWTDPPKHFMNTWSGAYFWNTSRYLIGFCVAGGVFHLCESLGLKEYVGYNNITTFAFFGAVYFIWLKIHTTIWTSLFGGTP